MGLRTTGTKQPTSSVGGRLQDVKEAGFSRREIPVAKADPSSKLPGILKWLLLVWLFSFVTIYLSSLLFRQPGYMDAYYYYHVAQNLASGRGFVEDFIWNYLYLPEAVTHPSNLHWMPLTSIVVAPFLSLLGESFRSAQVPMVFLASLLPPVTFGIGLRVLGTVRQALMAAVLTLFSGYYFIHWSAIDAFGLFGLTITFALLCLYGLVTEAGTAAAAPNPCNTEPSPCHSGPNPCHSEPAGEESRTPWMTGPLAAARGDNVNGCHTEPNSCHTEPNLCHSEPAGEESRSPSASGTFLPQNNTFQQRDSGLPLGMRQILLALLVGVLAGLSHLARADGVLLLPVAGLVLLLGHWFAKPAPGATFWARLRILRLAILFGVIVAGYLLTMLPWFIHNLSVLGSPLPLGSSQSIFLQEYNEFFSYNRELSLRTYLDWGIGPILFSKVEVLGRNLLVLLGMEHYLLPFIVIGFWSLRRNLWLMPFFVYGASLYLVMTLVFTFPASRGSMLHSSVALIPWFTCAAVQGIDRVIEEIALRRKHWKLPIAKRNIGIIFVSFSVMFSLIVIFQNAVDRDGRFNAYNHLAEWVQKNDPAALIMVADPPGYFFSSRRPSIVVPNEPPEVVVQAAKRYGATYVVLEDAHSSYLADLYEARETTPFLTMIEEFDQLQIYRVQDDGS